MGLKLSAVFTLILMAAGAACAQPIAEPSEQEIVITPVAYQTQTPSESPTIAESPTITVSPTIIESPSTTPLSTATALPTSTLNPRPTLDFPPFPTKNYAPTPVVSRGDRFGEGGTTWEMTYDGDLSTYFDSSYLLRQMIQIDFNTIVDFSGFRRYMTRDGSDATGYRDSRGEEVSYSVDGMNWKELKVATTRGWEDYTTDRRYVWRSLDYGWSPWLRPKTPVRARSVRFNWEDDNDAVNEIELDWIFPSAVPALSPCPTLWKDLRC